MDIDEAVKIAELLGNIATAVGLLLAALSAMLALRAYKAQLQGAADAHMHGLFRDYLSLEADAVSPAKHLRLGPLKLYALEEMLGWVLEQEGRLDRWPKWWRPKDRRARHASLEAWRETIRCHLAGDQGVIDNVRCFMSCYGAEFLMFVADTCDVDEDFRARAAAHLDAVNKGRPRPEDQR
jgi:hypothetical protein